MDKNTTIQTTIPIKRAWPKLVGSLDSVHYPAFAEIKYDGMAVNVICVNGDFYIETKGGYIIKNVPYMKQLVNHRTQKASVVFLAELYVNEGQNGALYQLLSEKNNHDVLKLAIYDIFTGSYEKDITNERVEVPSLSLLERKEMLYWFLGEHAIKTWLVNNKEEVMTIFEESRKSGFEGIVVKPLSSTGIDGRVGWVKVKDKDQNDFDVVNVDPNKERIIICVYGPPGSKTHENGYLVGVKCAKRFKPFIKPGDVITIEHCGRLKTGGLRHPVLIPKKEWL